MAEKRRRADDTGDEGRGWNAITAAFERLYPDQTDPLHVAAVPHPPFTEDGQLYGISIYRADGPPHWHFVTYGFTELYDKESDDPEVSGWGFELTFRLTRGAEDYPPAWAINFLMNLGKYVRRSGNPFGAGHHMDLNGPIALETDTAIRAIAFVRDPQVDPIDTPNGRVEFLQVVGITTDEMRACGDWQPAGVLDLLRAADPLLVTDLDRTSVLADPAAAARVQEGIDRDGSSAPAVYVSVVDWSAAKGKKVGGATATLGAKGVEELVRKLRSRLRHDRPFTLVGREKSVEFRPAEAVGWATDEGTLTVGVTPAAVGAMTGTLRPVRGEYRWPEVPGFALVVVPSTITDADGNVIEVVG